MLIRSQDITPTTHFYSCCRPCKAAKTKCAGRCPGLTGDHVSCFSGWQGGGFRVIGLNTPHIWWVLCFDRTWRTHFFKPCKKCQLCNSYNLLHSVNRSNSAADEKQPTQNHVNLLLEESISCPHFTNIYYYLFIPTPSHMWIYYTHPAISSSLCVIWR